MRQKAANDVRNGPGEEQHLTVYTGALYLRLNQIRFKGIQLAPHRITWMSSRLLPSSKDVVKKVDRQARAMVTQTWGSMACSHPDDGQYVKKGNNTVAQPTETPSASAAGQMSLSSFTLLTPPFASRNGGVRRVVPASDNDRTATADRKLRCGDDPGGPASVVLSLIDIQPALGHDAPLSPAAPAEAKTSSCELDIMRVCSICMGFKQGCCKVVEWRC